VWVFGFVAFDYFLNLDLFESGTSALAQHARLWSSPRASASVMKTYSSRALTGPPYCPEGRIPRAPLDMVRGLLSAQPAPPLEQARKMNRAVKSDVRRARRGRASPPVRGAEDDVGEAKRRHCAASSPNRALPRHDWRSTTVDWFRGPSSRSS